MNTRRPWTALKRLGRLPGRVSRVRPRGFTLVEVVVAIVVLSLIVISIPTAFLVVTDYRFRWDEQRVAESLARNHLEYVKVLPYQPGEWEDSGDLQVPQYDMGNLTSLRPNESWEVEVDALPIDGTTRLPLCCDEEDQGIQEITVTVRHVDKTVLEVTGYKTQRA